MPTFSALHHVKKIKEIPALGCELEGIILFLFWITFKAPF